MYVLVVDLLPMLSVSSSPPDLNSGARVVLLFVFMFLVPCCDVHYDFHIKTMFGSSLFVFFVHSGVQHILTI